MSRASSQFTSGAVAFFTFFSLLSPEFAFCQGTSRAPSSSPDSSVNRGAEPILVGFVFGMAIGVSTLSFYGRPQQRMGNIAYGAALGLIFGAAYSLVKSARRQFRDRRADNLDLQAPREGWENLSLTKGLDMRDHNWISFEVGL